MVYGYDSAGNRTSLTYPDGRIVTYTYDLASRLVQVTDWQAQATRYCHDALGRLLSVELPNGTTSLRGYDEAGC